MPRFSIIIVSWNALHHLKIFLPSVVGSDYPDFEIILADNASTDGSATWIRETYPHIKIVTFDKNYGYCGGNNRAVPYSTGDILLFLNNDVKVERDWLIHLARCFKQNETIAAVQPKMRSCKDPESFEYAGAAGGYMDIYGFPFCRGRIFDTVEKDRGQYDSQVPILWASGAALAVRKDLFGKAGGFDEDFEFHMEEIDLCWRLWNLGFSIQFCPKSVVYHLGGGSLPMGSSRKVYYNYRNSLIMLCKNYEIKELWRYLPVRILLDIISALRELFSGNYSFFGAIVKGHFHFYGSLFKTLQKRNNIRKKTSCSLPFVVMDKSIVWNYFVRGKKYFTEQNHEIKSR